VFTARYELELYVQFMLNKSALQAQAFAWHCHAVTWRTTDGCRHWQPVRYRIAVANLVVLTNQSGACWPVWTQWVAWLRGSQRALRPLACCPL